MFILVCAWFVGSLHLVIISSGKISTSWAVLITHTVTFSKQEVLKGRQCMVAQARINVQQAMGRRNNCKLKFFSMYFIQNNKEIHFYFKNSEK